MFLRDDPVPVDFLKVRFRKVAGNRAQGDRTIAQLRQLLFDDGQREGIVMLLKDFFLDDPVLLLKGVQQVEGDRPVRIVVPDLDKVDPCAVMEEGIVQVETLLFPPDLFPVP